MCVYVRLPVCVCVCVCVLCACTVCGGFSFSHITHGWLSFFSLFILLIVSQVLRGILGMSQPQADNALSDDVVFHMVRHGLQSHGSLSLSESL